MAWVSNCTPLSPHAYSIDVTLAFVFSGFRPNSVCDQHFDAETSTGLTWFLQVYSCFEFHKLYVCRFPLLPNYTRTACRLGEGSYGAVHKASNRSNGHMYAIKQIAYNPVHEKRKHTIRREINVMKDVVHVRNWVRRRNVSLTWYVGEYSQAIRSFQRGAFNLYVI